MNRKVTENQVLPLSWRKVRLGDVGVFSKGSGITKKELVEDGVPCVRYGELYTRHNFQIRKFYSFIANQNLDKRKLLKNNDLLFAGSGETRGEIGKSASFNGDIKAYAGGDVIICSLDPKELHSDFASFYLNTLGRKQINRLGQGDSIVHIYSRFLENVTILAPSLPEQKAIASLLEKWDTAIEKIEALITAKQQQLRWLVESLIGKKQYTAEWKVSTLGDIFKICTHSSKSKYIVDKGEKLVVDMGSISRTGQLISNKHTNIKVDVLQMNDLVMPKDDIGGGNIIGKVAIIDKGNKYICGDHVYRLVQKNVGDACFLRFLINCPPINRQLRSKANGTAQLGLGKRDVINQQVRLPPRSEQNCISNTLNTTQREINLLEQLAEKHRIQKRGLMQKLLTGNWRVNNG